jgi:PncC family amidohydrolase
MSIGEIRMTQNTNLAEKLGLLLKQRNLTISAAESCTGGLFTSALTDISGSSAYVIGSVVTYSNEAKQKLINVQESTLIAHGAVSEQTAKEMAIGVRDLFDTDYAISITGIAGPGGGTAEKPVGLVYIGMANPQDVAVRKFIWQGDRIENKVHSVNAALQWLINAVETNT